MRQRGKVCGVGVNDANYRVRAYVSKSGEKTGDCPFYSRWKDMISRCYSSKFQERQPTYVGCSVADEWLTFSVFRKWMESQRWRGLHLDKDILVPGNKVYSPDLCVFITKMTNSFVVDSGSIRGDYPIGVALRSDGKRFISYCNNPFLHSKKLEHLGCHRTPEQAHEAWRIRKYEHSISLANLQEDERVAEAIRRRYEATTEVCRR